MTIVTEHVKRRVYISPSAEQMAVASQAIPKWGPDTELPEQALGFRVQRYGMVRHRDLFTQRQLCAITTFTDLVAQIHHKVLRDSRGDVDYANAVSTFLALAVDRLAQTFDDVIRSQAELSARRAVR